MTSAPVTSVYEWEGKIERSSETLMIIKTRRSLTEDLIRFVNENHIYAVRARECCCAVRVVLRARVVGARSDYTA